MQTEREAPKRKASTGITGLSIQGFKSLAEIQHLEIRPLTLLAGANSSGKSSALQPLLLLKQTLESSHDPAGALLLNGSHVKFTSADQVLSRLGGQRAARELAVAIKSGRNRALRTVYRRRGDGFEIVRMMDEAWGRKELVLEPGMPSESLEEALPQLGKMGAHLEWKVARDRCFLKIEGYYREEAFPLVFPQLLVGSIARDLRSILHVPGLRGNPTRSYPTSAIGDSFSGPFEPYVASVVASWQRADERRLRLLGEHLSRLGLTWGVRAEPIDATQVELLVGRLVARRGSAAEDLVNIADVGFGVSQVLPVLVALLAAKPGQLVYLEQPELHLHPRAQEALASVLAEAAVRGVRVVVETHSSLLLLAVQTLVVQGQLPPEEVKLHWFQRNPRGFTGIHSADLDELGAYGEWPEDFGSVSLEADHRYLSAVEGRAFSSARNGKR